MATLHGVSSQCAPPARRARWPVTSVSPPLPSGSGSDPRSSRSAPPERGPEAARHGPGVS
ncbi:Hypothetical protein CAP_7772 [Chondromyces apiculatus DSM 436]|uniref:Uncharacterized protein n=1 Tax=Chondromyces apiculatus DSM 436 TaxID=1192034 RepID=A0A017SXU5_9BACT|nr:Hypothetical protein CAP_7772 [Chondromyces apiculatus DSM 436]